MMLEEKASVKEVARREYFAGWMWAESCSVECMSGRYG
jgi:hypothetical protein